MEKEDGKEIYLLRSDHKIIRTEKDRSTESQICQTLILRKVAKKIGKPFGKHLQASLRYGGVKEVDKGTALLKLYNFTDDAIVFPFQSPSDASEMVDDPELKQGKKQQN